MPQHDINTSLKLSPPWGTIAAWQEANLSIDFHLKSDYPELKPAVQIAGRTHSHLETLFPSLDDLCLKTCPRCPDACCLSASPWYDFRDLVFLHLNHFPIPLTQTISAMKETCCYLSHKGCTLPRMIRPWICTWYLCPTQMAKIRSGGFSHWQTLSRVLIEIKAFRKEMEDEFVRVIAK
jgi:hypothetical protein